MPLKLTKLTLLETNLQVDYMCRWCRTNSRPFARNMMGLLYNIRRANAYRWSGNERGENCCESNRNQHLDDSDWSWDFPNGGSRALYLPSPRRTVGPWLCVRALGTVDYNNVAIELPDRAGSPICLPEECSIC